MWMLCPTSPELHLNAFAVCELDAETLAPIDVFLRDLDATL